eukprot:m51a1_g1931 hypothetical protein (1459) ;mRNA; f:902595-908533
MAVDPSLLDAVDGVLLQPAARRRLSASSAAAAALLSAAAPAPPASERHTPPALDEAADSLAALVDACLEERSPEVRADAAALVVAAARATGTASAAHVLGTAAHHLFRALAARAKRDGGAQLKDVRIFAALLELLRAGAPVVRADLVATLPEALASALDLLRQLPAAHAALLARYLLALWDEASRSPVFTVPLSNAARLVGVAMRCAAEPGALREVRELAVRCAPQFSARCIEHDVRLTTLKVACDKAVPGLLAAAALVVEDGAGDAAAAALVRETARATLQDAVVEGVVALAVEESIDNVANPQKRRRVELAAAEGPEAAEALSEPSQLRRAFCEQLAATAGAGTLLLLPWLLARSCEAADRVAPVLVSRALASVGAERNGKDKKRSLEQDVAQASNTKGIKLGWFKQLFAVAVGAGPEHRAQAYSGLAAFVRYVHEANLLGRELDSAEARVVGGAVDGIVAVACDRQEQLRTRNAALQLLAAVMSIHSEVVEPHVPKLLTCLWSSTSVVKEGVSLDEDFLLELMKMYVLIRKGSAFVEVVLQALKAETKEYGPLFASFKFFPAFSTMVGELPASTQAAVWEMFVAFFREQFGESVDLKQFPVMRDRLKRFSALWIAAIDGFTVTFSKDVVQRTQALLRDLIAAVKPRVAAKKIKANTLCDFAMLCSSLLKLHGAAEVFMAKSAEPPKSEELGEPSALFPNGAHVLGGDDWSYPIGVMQYEINWLRQQRAHHTLEKALLAKHAHRIVREIEKIDLNSAEGVCATPSVFPQDQSAMYGSCAKWQVALQNFLFLCNILESFSSLALLKKVMTACTLEPSSPYRKLAELVVSNSVFFEIPIAKDNALNILLDLVIDEFRALAGGAPSASLAVECRKHVDWKAVAKTVDAQDPLAAAAVHALRRKVAMLGVVPVDIVSASAADRCLAVLWLVDAAFDDDALRSTCRGLMSRFLDHAPSVAPQVPLLFVTYMLNNEGEALAKRQADALYASLFRSLAVCSARPSQGGAGSAKQASLAVLATANRLVFERCAGNAELLACCCTFFRHLVCCYEGRAQSSASVRGFNMDVPHVLAEMAATLLDAVPAEAPAAPVAAQAMEVYALVMRLWALVKKYGRVKEDYVEVPLDRIPLAMAAATETVLSELASPRDRAASLEFLEAVAALSPVVGEQVPEADFGHILGLYHTIAAGGRRNYEVVKRCYEALLANARTRQNKEEALGAIEADLNSGCMQRMQGAVVLMESFVDAVPSFKNVLDRVMFCLCNAFVVFCRSACEDSALMTADVLRRILLAESLKTGPGVAPAVLQMICQVLQNGAHSEAIVNKLANLLYACVPHIKSFMPLAQNTITYLLIRVLRGGSQLVVQSADLVSRVFVELSDPENRRWSALHCGQLITQYIQLLERAEGVIMSPEVRLALRPGVFSMIGVCSDSTKQRIHRELSNAGRSIFNAMHSEWSRECMFTGKV